MRLFLLAFLFLTSCASKNTTVPEVKFPKNSKPASFKMHFWDGDRKPISYYGSPIAGSFSYRLATSSDARKRVRILVQRSYSLKPGRIQLHLTFSPEKYPSRHCNVGFIAYPGHSYQAEIRGRPRRCIVIDKTTDKIVASKDFR